MSKPLNNKLIKICSAAVGLVYTVGLVATPGSAFAQMAPRTVHSASHHVTHAAAKKPVVKAKSTKGKVKKPVIKKKLTYLDGTYYGQGYNRIGSVTVAVTIKNDKIASAQITQCATHYPQYYIDPVLPDQVVARQSANVDIVSGATMSTEDFAVAVQQALDNAKLALQKKHSTTKA